MNTLIRHLLIWGVIFIVFFSYYHYQRSRTPEFKRISHAELDTAIQQNKVKSIIVTNTVTDVIYTNNEVVYIPNPEVADLLPVIRNKGIKIDDKSIKQSQKIQHILNILPWLVLVLIWIIILKRRTLRR